MTRRAMAALGLSLTLVTTGAAAAPCDGARPWVHLEVDESVGGAGFQDALREQLAAGLARQQIDLCPANAPGESIARVRVGAGSGERVAITVRAFDQLTEKEVARAIDLSSLPRDAWALSLAVATDEILRASWAELAFESKRPSPREVPEAVRRSVQDAMAPALRPTQQEPRLGVGAAFAGEHYGAGHTQFGADARLSAEIVARFSVRLAVGLRGGSRVESSNGSVGSSALVIGGGPAYDLLRVSSWFGLTALARFDATRLELRGDASPSARGDVGTATAFYATAGLAPWLAPDPALHVGAEFTAGAPLRGAVATDDGRRVTGIDGVGLGAALWVEGRL